MTPTDQPDACFTDFALQEYVQGRLDADVRSAVELHCRTCAECRHATELLRTESEALRDALLCPPVPPAADTPDLATLAAYLDGALDDETVRQLEGRLASEPALLYALTRLQAEFRAVLAEEGEGVRVTTPQAPAGQILRMGKRVAPPTVVNPANLKYGGGQSA